MWSNGSEAAIQPHPIRKRLTPASAVNLSQLVACYEGPTTCPYGGLRRLWPHQGGMICPVQKNAPSPSAITAQGTQGHSSRCEDLGENLTLSRNIGQLLNGPSGIPEYRCG
jgi:hypothetical protein